MAPSLAAALKATLQPLWTSFCLFASKRTSLRDKALKGCFKESGLVQKLVETNPLSETLFDKDVVDEVFSQAEHQAKSVAALLQFRPSVRRKRQAPRGRGTPRTPRMRGQSRGMMRGQHQYQQYQSPSYYYSSPYRGGYQGGQSPGRQGNYGFQGFQQGYYNPRGYPSTPRRWANRGRGRGGRSPGTPKNTPPQHQQAKGF